MARTRQVVIDLEPTPTEYLLRNGVELPPGMDTTVRWDLSTSGIATPQPGGWPYLHEVWGQRFTLERDAFGEVPVYDAGAPVHHTVDLPTLTPRGVRSWRRIQIASSEPADTEIRWRVVGTTGVLWWDGAAWSAVIDPDLDWNTSAEIEAAFSSLPSTERSVALRADLRSRDTRDSVARPELYGVRILFLARELGDEDDALVRTLVQAIRGAIRSTATGQFTPGAAIQRIDPPAGRPYVFTATAPDVFDLTLDEDALEPLPGDWDTDTHQYHLDAAIPAGHKIRVEWEIAPRIEASVHRDAPVETLPSVYVFPDGSGDRFRGSGDVVVTSAHGGTPEGETAPADDLLRTRLEVRVVAELSADCRRIAAELERWVNAQGAIVSPETGRKISIRTVTPIVTTAGTLSVGVIDARGTWEVSYPVAGARLTDAVDYLRQGGLTPTVGAPEE